MIHRQIVIQELLDRIDHEIAALLLLWISTQHSFDETSCQGAPFWCKDRIVDPRTRRARTIHGYLGTTQSECPQECNLPGHDKLSDSPDVREYLAEYALHLQNNTVEKFIGPKFGVFGTEMRNYCREGHYFQLFDMLDASDGLLALARA